jgi:hypothetical protein
MSRHGLAQALVRPDDDLSLGGEWLISHSLLICDHPDREPTPHARTHAHAHRCVLVLPGLLGAGRCGRRPVHHMHRYAAPKHAAACRTHSHTATATSDMTITRLALLLQASRSKTRACTQSEELTFE